MPEPEPVEEAKPAVLGVAEAGALLTASNLPDASRVRLAEKDWSDEDALKDAIKAEVVYVTELTGAGRPVGQERPAVRQEEGDKDAELKERLDKIDQSYGVYRETFN